MSLHYVTFGSAHRHQLGDTIIDHNCVACFDVRHPQEGRHYAFKLFGEKFSFEYPEESFDQKSMRFFPRGIIRIDQHITQEMRDDFQVVVEYYEWQKQHEQPPKPQQIFCEAYARGLKAARAQSGQGAEPVALLRREIGETSWFDHNPVKPDTPEAGWIKNSNIWDYCEVYTQPQPAQQGGVPEGHVAIPKDVAAAKGMYLVGYSWLKHNAPDELTTPQPEGDGWIKCSERLPTEADDDFNGCVWARFEDGDIELMEAEEVEQTWDDDISITHWKLTGLNSPQPPQEGSGDE